MTEDVRQASSDKSAIRPFQVGFPEAALGDLRRRVNATRWPEQETVSDDSQGVRLAMMRELARYWASDYDWHKCQARLNDLPQFITEIDGLDIHFIHVRSPHSGALPLIVTHGWPGSVIEQLKIIEPLANPTAHGASAADAFDLVIPSLPGHGFSAKPASTGWDPARIARAWAVLMTRLGYPRFVAQGGDWGAAVTQAMGIQASPMRNGAPTSIPYAISVFPGELYQAPRSWAERAYPHNLIYYNNLDRGGHFAAWEQPDLCAAEIRAAFRSLR